MGDFLTVLRRALPWLLVGLLSVALTTLVVLPARWLTPQVGRFTGQRVELVDATGTLWQGAASLRLGAGHEAQSATVLPGRLHWRTAFWPLLLGRLHLDAWHDAAMRAPVPVEAGFASLRIGEGAMRLPVSLFTGLGAPFNTLALDGVLHAEWGVWRIVGARAYGQMSLRLDEASTPLSRVRPLGSYRMALQASGEAVDLRLSSASGPLWLDGQGRYAAGRLHFDGQARAEPARAATLAPLLGLLGMRRPDGSVGLSYRR